MLAAILPYFERELEALRQQGTDFARRYPKIARRLVQEDSGGADPHVERLVEGFALLTGRIHQTLDEGQASVAEAFLRMMFPHYLQPVPSISLLQCQAAVPHRIPRGERVFAPPVSTPTGRHTCEFRTCCDLELWPIRLQGARLEEGPRQSARLTLDFVPESGQGPVGTAQGPARIAQGPARTAKGPVGAAHDLAGMAQNLTGTAEGSAGTAQASAGTAEDWTGLGPDRLRLFLDGEAALTGLLYEMCTVGVQSVRASTSPEDTASWATLPNAALRLTGFSREEALLASDPRSLGSHRLLAEYFTYPEKFLFLELLGLQAASRPGAGGRLQIQVLLKRNDDVERFDRLCKAISPAFFKLGCTPVVNLFQCSASPVLLEHHQASYPVLVDPLRQDAFEIYAINDIYSLNSRFDEPRAVPSLYAPHLESGEESGCRWVASQRPSKRPGDRGLDMDICFVDPHFEPVRPAREVLSLDVTCTNRDLPERIPFGKDQEARQEDFCFAGPRPVQRARLLRRPSPSVRPVERSQFHWRLVSHLLLNPLSLEEHGREALQCLLRLYNLSGSAVADQQIQGIVALRCQPGTARIPGGSLPAQVRGLEIHVTLDESFFVGSNLMLFAAVLEQFYAQACPANRFIRFHLWTKQREGEVFQWPARVGDMTWT